METTRLQTKMKDLRLFAVVVALACVAGGGCADGPTLGEVAGTVTHQGAAVAFAAVDFQPVTGGKSSIGWTDEEGQYVAQYTLSQPGALLGRHKIGVRTYPKEGEKPIPVPPEFGANSSFEFTVEPGSNRLDIKL